MLVLTLLTADPVLADTAACGGVLTDTGLSTAARRELATQCLKESCQQEAQELQLAPEATARFMTMCLTDEFELVSGQVATTGRGAAPAVNASAITCPTDDACADMTSGLDATAAGLRAGSRANAGHSFVRVPRINEVIER